MPILGITASSVLKVSDTGVMFPLQNIIVGSSGASSISFNNIPNTYTHLQIRGIGRYTTTTKNLYFDFNGDTTASNYYTHALYGDGSTAGSGGTQLAIIGSDAITSSGETANTFGAVVIDILDYANTNKNKVSRALGGNDLNGSGTIRLTSALWMNTNAITSITLKPQSGLGANFAQNSSFALYGIKGA
jgi:hypothetical protein